MGKTQLPAAGITRLSRNIEFILKTSFFKGLFSTCREATKAPILGCDVIPLILSTATSTTSAPAYTAFNMEATPEKGGQVGITPAVGGQVVVRPSEGGQVEVTPAIGCGRGHTSRRRSKGGNTSSRRSSRGQ